MATMHLDKQRVIAYLIDWHGEHEECDIMVALREYEAGEISFSTLIQIADEVDTEWREGFENSIYNAY